MDRNLVYLVQTDTTIGFSSSSYKRLNLIKNREKNKKILQTTNSFQTLKNHTRVPNKYKKLVRKSEKTTFIYPNGNSYRVIFRGSSFYDFVEKFNIFYSTSANKSSKKYDEKFAFLSSDIIVQTKDGFCEDKPSMIIKLSKNKKRIIR